MCACVKDQISTMQHDRDKKEEEVNDQTTEGAQPMLETLWKHLFI